MNTLTNQMAPITYSAPAMAGVQYDEAFEVPAYPDRGRTAIAMATAIEVASKIQMEVFESIMSGAGPWRQHRAMVTLTHRGGAMVPNVTLIEDDAILLSAGELASAIVEPGCAILSTAELVALADACDRKLKARGKRPQVS